MGVCCALLLIVELSASRFSYIYLLNFDPISRLVFISPRIVMSFRNLQMHGEPKCHLTVETNGETVLKVNVPKRMSFFVLVFNSQIVFEHNLIVPFSHQDDICLFASSGEVFGVMHN